MRIIVLTSLISWSLAQADQVRFDRQTVRQFARVTKSICEGYLDLLNPVAGVRDLRARARAEHNRAVFAFEDLLLQNSTSPFIRPSHGREENLRTVASRDGLIIRVLVNHRRLHVEGEGLRELPRGTAVLVDPRTDLVASAFPPGT